jgi:hypothetical protein
VNFEASNYAEQKRTGRTRETPQPTPFPWPPSAFAVRPAGGGRNYRVILKLDGDDFEIGSIGVQHEAAWRWGIDTVIPMRAATKHHTSAA